MTNPLWIVLGTVAYTLIAVRIAVVFNRASVAVRNETNRFDAALVGAAWPAMAVIFGFIILLSGDPGIYRAAALRDHDR